MNQFIIHHNDAYQQDALSEYMKSVMICTVQSHTAGSLLEVVSVIVLLIVMLVAWYRTGYIPLQGKFSNGKPFYLVMARRLWDFDLYNL